METLNGLGIFELMEVDRRDVAELQVLYIVDVIEMLQLKS